MIINLLERFKSGRNKNLYKSISMTFLAKGLSAVCNLLYISISISYINPGQFGIWLTLSSVIGWLMFLDVGLGNGLKNHLGEALAAKNLCEHRLRIPVHFPDIPVPVVYCGESLH
jgi:hypothetical protein